MARMAQHRIKPDGTFFSLYLGKWGPTPTLSLMIHTILHLVEMTVAKLLFSGSIAPLLLFFTLHHFAQSDTICSVAAANMSDSGFT